MTHVVLEILIQPITYLHFVQNIQFWFIFQFRKVTNYDINQDTAIINDLIFKWFKIVITKMVGL